MKDHLFIEPDITNYIKINRLSWAGHITRTENMRSVKNVFATTAEGAGKIEAKTEMGGRCDPGYQAGPWEMLLKKARLHTGLSSL
jgi:hypothetical protein